MAHQQQPADKSDTVSPFHPIAQSPCGIYFLAKNCGVVYLFDVDCRISMPYWQALAMRQAWGFRLQMVKEVFDGINIERNKIFIGEISLKSTLMVWLKHPDVQGLVRSVEAGNDQDDEIIEG